MLPSSSERSQRAVRLRLQAQKTDDEVRCLTAFNSSSLLAGASGARLLLRSWGGGPIARGVLTVRPAQVAQGADGKPKLDPEAVTKKWGLEAGLFNIFTSKEEAGQSGQSKGQQVGRQLVCAKCCAAVPCMQPRIC